MDNNSFIKEADLEIKIIRGLVKRVKDKELPLQ
jgi:hypothetical protein